MILFRLICRKVLLSMIMAGGILGVFAQTVYYVAPAPAGNDANAGSQSAPFATIAKARDVVRTLNKSQDITVYLRTGRYVQPSTLTFGPSDAGGAGNYITYQAFPSETPVISGGKQITGWTLHDQTNNIWKASVVGGPLAFRQLYVNGLRAVRARLADLSDEQTFGSFPGYLTQYNNGEAHRLVPLASVNTIPSASIKGVEMTVPSDWTAKMRIAQSYTVSGALADVVFNKYCTWGPRFYYHLENAYEWLNAPGEWYLNKTQQTVYYKPRAWENMATADVVAPSLLMVVQMLNTSRIQFKGVRFEHSTWLRPDAIGFSDIQANMCLTVSGDWPNGYTRDTMLVGAVDIDGSSNIRFEGCSIRHAGGHGVRFVNTTSNNAIVGSDICDISGNGIAMDYSGSTGDTIANNYLWKCSRDYPGGCVIAAMYPANLMIEHNEVWNNPYTGISVGWGWTTGTTHLANNTIRYNNIHDVVTYLTDGGGIYMLSKQQGTMIFENYIHNINQSLYSYGAGTKGIHLDQGSSYFTVDHNVFQDFPGNGSNEIISHNQTSNLTETRNDTQDPAVISNAGVTAQYATRAPFRITSPLSRSYYYLPGSVTFTTTNKDRGVAVNKVEFYNGNAKIGEATQSPFSFTWTNPVAGTIPGYQQISIMAKAELADGSITRDDVLFRLQDKRTPDAPAGTKAGLLCQMFLNNSDSWPSGDDPWFDKTTPAVSGISKNFNEKLAVDAGYKPADAATMRPFYRFRGYVVAPTEGVYTFSPTEQYSLFMEIFIGKPIWQNGIAHNYAPISSVYLKQGRHAISAIFSVGNAFTYNTSSRFRNMISWSGPGIPRDTIPSSYLTYSDSFSQVTQNVPIKADIYNKVKINTIRIYNLQGAYMGRTITENPLQIERSLKLRQGTYVMKIDCANGIEVKRLAVVGK